MSDASTFNPQIEIIRRKLSTVTPPPREALANKSNAAAVLVPMFERKGELHIVYIRRSDHVASHRGQVAFPGGRVDPVDATLLDAALREAHEEVGIHPQTVEVIGAFATMQTTTSGIVVAPFVGVIPSDAPLKPQLSEVARNLRRASERAARSEFPRRLRMEERRPRQPLREIPGNPLRRPNNLGPDPAHHPESPRTARSRPNVKSQGMNYSACPRRPPTCYSIRYERSAHPTRLPGPCTARDFFRARFRILL